MTIILTILAILLLLTGLLGTLIPALPGLPLMFVGTWLLAYLGNYAVIGSTTLVIIAVITLLGMSMDFIASLLGTKFSGASKSALICSAIFGIIGIFFGLPGMVFGPIVGAMFGELWARRSLLSAGKVGLGTFFGYLVGVAAKVGCALTILITIISMFIISLF